MTFTSLYTSCLKNTLNKKERKKSEVLPDIVVDRIFFFCVKILYVKVFKYGKARNFIQASILFIRARIYFKKVALDVQGSQRVFLIIVTSALCFNLT